MNGDNLKELEVSAQSDKIRAEFMCKMNWNEARMSKYENCCCEHGNGKIKNLTFNLLVFWIGWAIILVNFLPFFHKWLPSIKVSDSVILIAFTILFFGSISANSLIVRLRKFYYESILKLPVFLPSERASEKARKGVEVATTEIRCAQLDIRKYKSPSCKVKAEEREEAAERKEEQAFRLLEQLEKQSEDWLIALHKKYALRYPAAAKRAITIRIEQAEQRDKWYSEWENERYKSTNEHAEWKSAREEKLRELTARTAKQETKYKGEQSISMTLSGSLARVTRIDQNDKSDAKEMIDSSGLQELVASELIPTVAIGDERFIPPPNFRIRLPCELLPSAELLPVLNNVVESSLLETADPGPVPELKPELELAPEPEPVFKTEAESNLEFAFDIVEMVPVQPRTQILPPNMSKPNEWEASNLTRTRTAGSQADPVFDPEPALEGRRKLRTNYAVVRNPKLRIMAIQIHGRSCCVCGFNFDAFFGKELARGYIEVHHLNNVASGERTTDPAKDLAPLCANCHAMADRLTVNIESPPRSIAQLRELLIPPFNNQIHEDA